MEAPPRVIIPLAVAERFTREIRAHPRVEVGGKYVGFVRGAARYETLDERRLALRELTFEVTDYLDDGPEAYRTPSFHRGDARWQTAEFRKLEARQPDIEQLGSWHSHHPNGLAMLSLGDIRGYQETVNHPGHNHDFFFVSLGVDLDGFPTARHYIFIRGSRDYYPLPRTSIEVVAHPPNPPVDDSGTTDRPGTPEAEEAETLGQTGEGDHQPPAADSQPESARPWPARGTAQPANDRGPAADRHDSDGELRSVPGWSESSAGRKAIRAEYKLLRKPEFAHLRLSIAQGRLLARGWVDTSVGRVSVSLLYPSTADREDGLLKLATIDQPVISATISGALACGLKGLRTSLKQFAGDVARRRPRTREEQGETNWWRNLTRWD